MTPESLPRDFILTGATASGWQVAHGRVDLFAVSASGRRLHLFSVGAGDCLLPFPDSGPAVIAVPALETVLHPLDTLPPADTLNDWLDHLAALTPGTAPQDPAFPAVLAATLQDRLDRRDSRATEREEGRRSAADSGMADGFRAIAAAIAARPAPPPSLSEAGADPDGTLYALVLHALQVPVPPPRPGQRGLPAPDRLKQAGLRLRPVQLRGEWWRTAYGPMLGRCEDRTIALIPDGAGRYLLHDPAAVAPQPVTADIAETLSAEAALVYPRLPMRLASWAEVVRFAFADGGPDRRTMILIAAAGALLSSTVPVASGWLFEHIIPAAALNDLWQIALALILMALGAGAFEAARALLLVRMEGRADWRTQSALFDRLLRLPVGFFKAYTIGDLTDRALSVHHARSLLSSAVLGGMVGMLVALPSLGLLFFYNVKLALVALALVLTGSLLTAFTSSRQVRHEALKLTQAGRVQGLVLQLLNGIAKLRVSAAERRGLGAWASAYARQQQHLVASQRWANVTEIFLSAFPLLCSLVIFACAAWFLKDALTAQATAAATDPAKTAPVMTTADFIAFNTAFGQFIGAMTSGVLAITGALGAIPYLQRARPIIDAVPESTGQRRDPGTLKGAIEASGLSFRYGPGDPLVLDRLSFRIEAGQFVAIVGTSGSGKSTLLRLLTGFETPSEGDLRFDGQPLETLDVDILRRQMGVVLQHGRVMSGSVMDNIVGTSGLGQDEAWDAARMAGLDADITAMPMGMHTVLPDGGASLSGGQRQRLLIARALVRRPALLLLDEATSALDNLTQAIVSETLSRLTATRIVVAHRLSTIRHADRILVLDGGRLVEDGPYDTLMAKDGAFAALARRQLL
ncbi:NHLP bacteriocin export ABC transporter permease/ATPase subunit [Novispirillum itersonii]|uniref:NHLM bacteriocin system ABC transporter ATP-binding protein n=1 Tax=Novispirillum itersonii TaxID=189 RepID=A0A7X0DNR0_NOVIT|nr:NHLP bacteriocin export ABC transporter permease/ATPase subunit [Novispirillum itersonii]MBB6212250.1 NHLM bacteriocin system ABC transporter ATP-binding protein [Novispirillum itersonii]